jgi:hypothetical protein
MVNFNMVQTVAHRKPKTEISPHAASPTASHLIRRRRQDKLLNFGRMHGYCMAEQSS